MQTEDQAWVDYRQRFSAVFDDANYKSPLQRWVMHASHRLLEKDFPPDISLPNVLEIGAGTGEHLSFVRHHFEHYTLTDVDGEALQAAREKHQDLPLGRLSFERQTGTTLPYADGRFDRVIAIHVLEHIPHPHLAIKEWIRVVKPGGTLSILIPTDPGIAWRLGRHLGPRRNALAQGFAYDYIMAREHINACNNLIALLRYYCRDIRERWWPFLIPSLDINLFYGCHVTISPTQPS